MSTAGRWQRAGKWPRPWLWLAAPAVLSGAACAQILGLEEWNGGSTSGGGGAGTGASSSSSSSVGDGSLSSASSTSSSSAVSASSSGTGGACPCGPDPSECQSYACVNGKCVIENVLAQTPTAMQTPYDCVTRVCDGKGMVTTQPDLNDVPPPPSVCHHYQCVGMKPEVFSDPVGYTCALKQTCNGSAVCQTCIGNTPCANGCADGAEADTDCGSVCGAGKLCVKNQHCNTPGDCINSACMNNVCQ